MVPAPPSTVSTIAITYIAITYYHSRLLPPLILLPPPPTFEENRVLVDFVGTEVSMEIIIMSLLCFFVKNGM